MNNLHPIFQKILENALNVQIERERNKIVKPREWHPETYLEFHESREELGIIHSDYGQRGWF